MTNRVDWTGFQIIESTDESNAPDMLKIWPARRLGAGDPIGTVVVGRRFSNHRGRRHPHRNRHRALGLVVVRGGGRTVV